MRIWRHSVTLLILASFVSISLQEPISLAIGAGVMAASGLFFKYRHEIHCKFYECCDQPYVSPDFPAMRSALYKYVFGQHLVLDTVWNAISTHWKVSKPKKPLVLSFHGYTGSGKNHVSRIIVENLFKKGMKSNFVHHIVATSEYPDKSRMEEYQIKLRERILNAAQKCGHAVFIFDEIDKLPEQLLGAIKPFLDYYDSVRNVDFRRCIFIFLSNRGGNAIANLALQHHEAGKVREALTLKNFEGVVMNEVYNSEGGLQMSELISNHLIDHFVPFLPLERQHVVLCTHDHLRMRERPDLIADTDFVNRVVDSLQYFPKGSSIFSSSGCKRVAHKADLEMSKMRPPPKELEDILGDEHTDEL